MKTEVDWPDDFQRTPEADRRPYPHGFQVSQTEAFKNILSELNKLDDATNISIETAAEHRPRWENIPVESAAPDDPGVVAYWNQDGKKYAAPCDKWDNLRDNAQAIYHYLKAKRGMERWGVKVEDEYVTQQVEKVPLDG